MSEDMPESFRDHLDRASATVATWPEWKRNLLGKPSRKENVKMSETEKAPWQAAFEKKYRKAYWDRLPETSKQHHKEYYDACIAEHYRRLPPGDEGLAKIHQDALAATGHGWIPWDSCAPETTVDSIQAMGAVTAAMRQRGWLEPEEVETLKRYHELTKRNVTFWCERSRESAEVVDAQNARIAELEAELAALRARAECTITPDDAEKLLGEFTIEYGDNLWSHDQPGPESESDWIEAMRRVLERRPGKVEPTAQPTPKPPTEAEIQAAIDARRDHFSDCEYRVKLRRLRHGPHVSMHKEASSLWTKHRRVPNLDWLNGYQQAALDLMRIQRWEKKQDKPCSFCNAEPSSIKVETLPHEVTWREVEEAVRAAQEQHPEGVGVEFDEAFGYWHTRVCVGQEDTPHEAIEDALAHLRKLAQPKPEPITPEKLWSECGGTGSIPKWAREAALAEAGRRNAKGGE